MTTMASAEGDAMDKCTQLELNQESCIRTVSKTFDVVATYENPCDHTDDIREEIFVESDPERAGRSFALGEIAKQCMQSFSH